MLLTSRVVPVQAMPATVLPAIVWAQSAAGSSWGSAVLAFLCSSDGDQGVPSFSAPKAENGRFYSFQNRSMPFLNETEGLLLSPALEGWARCHCMSPGFKWDALHGSAEIHSSWRFVKPTCVHTAQRARPRFDLPCWSQGVQRGCWPS